MDDVERKVSLFGVGIALVIAIIWAVEWVKKTPVKTTQNSSRKDLSAAYPKHVDQFCEHILKASDSYWRLDSSSSSSWHFFSCSSPFVARGPASRASVFSWASAWALPAWCSSLGCLARRARLSTAALRRGVVVGIEQGAKEIAQAKRRAASRHRSLRPNRLPRPVPSHHPRVQALHPKAETAQALNRAKTRS